MFGYLGPQKGINLLADALSTAPTDIRVVLAGRIADGYDAAFHTEVERMRHAGARVELRLDWLPEGEALGLLAEVRCAVIAYPRLVGLSSVVLDAASVGTPVVAHARGEIGHVVRDNKIGLVVDCLDRNAFRRALDELVSQREVTSRYADRLRAFVTKSDGSFDDGILQAIA